MTQVSPETRQRLQAIIDSYVTKPNGVPGLVCSVKNRDGESVFQHAAGKREIDANDPMVLESVLWVASCTKFVTGIAAMQLVEQGRLSLDDGDQIEKYLPELKDVKVLKETANGLELVEKKRQITLRMLLTHTGNSPMSSACVTGSVLLTLVSC